MGKMLTMADIRKKAVEKDMPLGTTEAVFEKIDYRDDGEVVTGAFIHFEGYKSIYLPFTNGEINYQLSYLLEQLGLETYDPDEINKTAGSVVKVSRYLKETEKDMDPQEYLAFKKKYEGNPPMYFSINEKFEGKKCVGAKITSTFTNTNFNLKTIPEE